MGRVADWGRQISWLWPAIAPLAVMVVGSVLFDIALDKNLPFEITPRSNGPVPGSESARFWVMGSYLLFMGASAAAVAATVVAMRRLTRPARNLGYSVVLLLIAIAVIATYWDRECRLLYECLGKNVFQKTLNKTELSMLGWISYTGTVAGIVAGSALAIAVAALGASAPPVLAGKPSDERLAREYARRISDLKYLLYAASALLFTGALHIKAWHEWPLPFLVEYERQHSIYKDLAVGTLNFQALYFVLVLAAMFLPMAVQFRRAVLALADEAKPSDEDRESWLKAHALDFSITDQAKGVIALVSPFFAAPLVELVKRFAE